MKTKPIIIIKEGWSKEKCRNICEDDVLFKELEGIEGFFKLNKEAFVGIYTSSIQSGRITIYSCPKYFDFDIEMPYTEKMLNNVKEHMNLICRTIEQLRKEGRNFEDSGYQFSAYDNYSKKKSVNAYELADFILNDYAKNGLFHHRNKQQKVNSKGRTIWPRTVTKLQPIIDKDEVIYTKVINKFSTKDYSQLLTSIHRYIVNKCGNFLQLLGKYEDIELPEWTYEFGDNLGDYYDYILTQLSYVYTNRDIALLKALASWCDISNFYKAFSGTTCFDKVWEYVTKEVWGNIDETRSEKPNFYIESQHGEEQVYEGSGEEIPDIIRVVKNGSKICIGVFDAKYYYPSKIYKYKKNVKGCVWGFPPNSDIVKQIAYYNNLKKTYGEKLYYANVFLMPEFSNEICRGLNIEISDKLYEFRGYVESGTNNSVKDVLIMNGYNINDMKKSDDIVEIFTVNPETLYKKYLSESRKISNDKIYEDFIKKYEDLVYSKKNEYKSKEDQFEA